MKKTFLATFSLLTLFAVILISCNGGVAPRTSLKNSVDSVSYAYGVTMADQGLTQYLEQLGVLYGTTDIEQDYQSRIFTADSASKLTLEAEMAAKLDSIKRLNAPRLKQFIKGLKDVINLKEKSPYASGLSVGTQFSQQMLPQVNNMLFGDDSQQTVNNNQVLAGLIATLKKQELAIEKDEAGVLVQNEFEKAQLEQAARHEEEMKAQYQDEVAVGEAFLKENAEKEGVVTLPSGLQYEIVREGKGAIPEAKDRVIVHYHGTLIDGTVFDSSVERGEPATFGVKQVIPGWSEALQLMPVGSKWKLYIPSDLAYGSSDQGTIKPFSTLIFDVELFDIEK